MKSLLFSIICFIAITTLFAGIILMSVPDGSMLRLPISLLHSTVFKDFRLPGFLLFLFVGGINFLAAFNLLINNKKRFNWTLLAGIITVLWVMIQWMLIGNTMLTDLVYFFAGASIVLLSLQLKGRSLI
jgi:hypothetical protein